MRRFDSLQKSLSVLYVAAVIVNPRIEYVVERKLPEKMATQSPQHMFIRIASPQGPEISYRGDFLFILFQKVHKIFIRPCFELAQNNLRDFLVFNRECNDRLTKVFWNVFGLVFERLRRISFLTFL
jgi:hypothetical protein